MSEKVLSPKERSAAARARLLAAANELFYAEGVQSVGIDRVIAHAGVAKATLYSAFGSRDGLVRAYLQARHAATAERMAHELETRYDTPKERLVGAFEVQGLSFTEPGFRGCAFISASADAPPGGVVEQVAQDYRTWLHELFFDLAQQAGAKDAKSLAHQLVLLYDGAGISAWLDRDPSAETAARTVAATLVDTAIPD
ncbi:TetR/AcrR family transcriptional regulator [Streptomyces sp. NPDC056656]|uniref:TetR/AcrR family transcriptional regulator n=1 Tax=Streptomyces sp. NPDC056656 TaxID=3345895 RepID=UPI0036837889